MYTYRDADGLTDKGTRNKLEHTIDSLYQLHTNAFRKGMSQLFLQLRVNDSKAVGA